MFAVVGGEGQTSVVRVVFYGRDEDAAVNQRVPVVHVQPLVTQHTVHLNKQTIRGRIK